MKNIKLVSLIIGLAIFALAGFVTVSSASAQGSNERMLIVTPYERGQNLSFFFNNSAIPLEYFEVEDVPPVFISIVTPDQLEVYKKEGYSPVIVDEEAGNIEQYYLLYGKRFDNTDQYELLQDDIQQQNGLELAYPITNYTTLVKVAPGLEIGQLNIPDLERSHPNQLIGPLTPPASRTTDATIANAEPVTQIDRTPSLSTIIVSIFVILAVIGAYVFQVKRARNT